MPYTLTKTNQDALLEAAATLTSSEGWFKDAVAFAAMKEEGAEPCAIGVFQNFAGRSAEFHFSTIGTRLHKKLLEAYLTLSFHPKMLGLGRLFAHIPASNVAAQRAALSVGFQFEYRKRGSAAGGEDAIVLSLQGPLEAE